MATEKVAPIKIPGADNEKEEIVEAHIAQGSTVADILRKLGKDPDKWILTLAKTDKHPARTFSKGDVVFSYISEGDKLLLTPVMEEGVTPSSARRAIYVTHREPITVAPDPVPSWRELGWTRNALGQYTGRYSTPYGSWEGRIGLGFLGFKTTHIKNPPAEIRYHPHHACFIYRGGGWFVMHWRAPKPRHPSEAITNMQRILCESFRRAGRA